MEASDDSDDDVLGDLLGPSAISATPNTTINRSIGPNNATGLNTSNDIDELGLIPPPPGSRTRHKLMVEQAQMALQATHESEKLKSRELFMNLLRQQLRRELADNGTTTAKIDDRIIDNLISESEDIHTYSRRYYLFHELPVSSGPTPVLYGLNWKTIDVKKLVEKYNLTELPFKSTSMDFLQQIDNVLDELFKVGKTTQLHINTSYKELGIVDLNVKFKLDHINGTPGVNLLRTSIFLKLHVLNNTITSEHYKLFLLTLCDSNAIQYEYPLLVQFSKLFDVMYAVQPMDILQIIDNIDITVFNLPQDMPIHKYKYQLIYHVLSVLNSTCSSPIIMAATRQFIGFESNCQFAKKLLKLSSVNVIVQLGNPVILNELHLMHYSLRLLNYVITVDITDNEALVITRDFSQSKSGYHNLLGKVAFAEDVNDKYNQIPELLQILNQDYTYIHYYHVKFSQRESLSSHHDFYH